MTKKKYVLPATIKSLVSHIPRLKNLVVKQEKNKKNLEKPTNKHITPPNEDEEYEGWLGV